MGEGACAGAAGGTVGVEQEFLLVDPETRRPVPRGPDVRRLAGRDTDLNVQLELTPYQVETATPVCATVAELGEQVHRGRELLAAAAERAGCRLVASGLPPVGHAAPPPRSDVRRYDRIVREHRGLVRGQGVCGCHVHVGVPDRDCAAQVCNHIRPWLPILLALSANSPLQGGVDTGYASWRWMVWSRWPVAGPPPYFASATEHDRLVRTLIDSGALIDPAMVYWDVRLSPRLPTVEVRVADVPLTTAEVELLAALIRALVVVAVEDVRRARPAPSLPEVMLRAALWRAARDGMEGAGVDPATGRQYPAWELLDRLVERVRPGLVEHGELATAWRQLAVLRRHGNGATGQRALLRAGASTRDVVDFLVRTTLGEPEPDPQVTR
jgi:glutamate---cysteine ligase / carboxylate-amine ligase